LKKDFRSWSIQCIEDDKPLPLNREQLYQMLRQKSLKIGDRVTRLEDNKVFSVIRVGTFATLKDEEGVEFNFKKQRKGLEFEKAE